MGWGMFFSTGFFLRWSGLGGCDLGLSFSHGGFWRLRLLNGDIGVDHISRCQVPQ
ncbi:hypothetical protein M758_UG108400 [Ceratodon purpureus]|nr:hypothetical protein M758_UG108400 [Ceratodon purpureus]